MSLVVVIVEICLKQQSCYLDFFDDVRILFVNHNSSKTDRLQLGSDDPHL